MSQAIVTHSFDIERTRSWSNHTSATMLGYAYATSLFSKENPPQIIHLEGRSGNGKTSFAQGVAMACTGERYPDEYDERRRHFNWVAKSGALSDSLNVTLLDSSTLKNPETDMIYMHIDSLLRPGLQIMMIEHAASLIDQQFLPDSPLRDRAKKADLRIRIGDVNDANKQSIMIDVLNPDTINADGLALLEQKFQPKMPWCKPGLPGRAP